MRIAYLGFLYKNPRLFAREVEVLSSEGSSFFIHVDGNRPLNEFAGIRGDNVFFSRKRIPVYWGEFSGVRAILLLIEQALAHSSKYEYFVLLSGSEYPLRTRSYIERFLEKNRGKEFVKLVKVPSPGKPVSRVTTIRYESNKPVRRLASRVLARVGLANRDYREYFGDLEPYSGCTWWTLTRNACEFILGFAESNPRVTGFFENTFAPEESFFQTILGNSPYSAGAVGGLVYEDWSQSGAHPAMINEGHVAQFASCEGVFDLNQGPSERLFARKFSDDSFALLARIDDMAARKGDT